MSTHTRVPVYLLGATQGSSVFERWAYKNNMSVSLVKNALKSNGHKDAVYIECPSPKYTLIYDMVTSGEMCAWSKYGGVLLATLQTCMRIFEHLMLCYGIYRAYISAPDKDTLTKEVFLEQVKDTRLFGGVIHTAVDQFNQALLWETCFGFVPLFDTDSAGVEKELTALGTVYSSSGISNDNGKKSIGEMCDSYADFIQIMCTHQPPIPIHEINSTLLISRTFQNEFTCSVFDLGTNAVSEAIMFKFKSNAKSGIFSSGGTSVGSKLLPQELQFIYAQELNKNITVDRLQETVIVLSSESPNNSRGDRASTGVKSKSLKEIMSTLNDKNGQYAEQSVNELLGEPSEDAMDGLNVSMMLAVCTADAKDKIIEAVKRDGMVGNMITAASNAEEKREEKLQKELTKINDVCTKEITKIQSRCIDEGTFDIKKYAGVFDTHDVCMDRSPAQTSKDRVAHSDVASAKMLMKQYQLLVKENKHLLEENISANVMLNALKARNLMRECKLDQTEIKEAVLQKELKSTQVALAGMNNRQKLLLKTMHQLCKETKMSAAETDTMLSSFFHGEETPAYGEAYRTPTVANRMRKSLLLLFGGNYIEQVDDKSEKEFANMMFDHGLYIVPLFANVYEYVTLSRLNSYVPYTWMKDRPMTKLTMTDSNGLVPPTGYTSNIDIVVNDKRDIDQGISVEQEAHMRIIDINRESAQRAIANGDCVRHTFLNISHPQTADIEKSFEANLNNSWEQTVYGLFKMDGEHFGSVGQSLQRIPTLQTCRKFILPYVHKILGANTVINEMLIDTCLKHQEQCIHNRNLYYTNNATTALPHILDRLADILFPLPIAPST